MDLSKHLETAADAVKRRNYPFAVKLYTQLLGLQPDNGDARAGLRLALFKKAEQKPPSKLIAMIGGGVSLFSAALGRLFGAHSSAAKSYERYLALDPLNEGVNLKLADSLERAGFQKSALAVYKAYAEHQPRCLVASRSAGALLYEAGDYQGALAMYEQALKVDPRDQESLKARKNLAAEGALRSSGIEDAKHSRDLIKDQTEQRRLEKASRLQLSDDEIEEELQEVEERIANNPDDIKSLMRVGELLVMRGEKQAALDSYERALQLDPSRSELADKAGDLRLDLQAERVEKARKRGDDSAAERAEQALHEARVGEYRRRVEANPTDLGLRFELGESLLHTGAHDDAIQELQQSVKDPRNKAQSLLLLGKAFRAKDLGDLALGQLEKALEASRSGGVSTKDVLYELGDLAEQLGKTDEALEHFSKILEEDIGFKDVAEKVQQLKSSAG